MLLVEVAAAPPVQNESDDDGRQHGTSAEMAAEAAVQPVSPAAQLGRQGGCDPVECAACRRGAEAPARCWHLTAAG